MVTTSRILGPDGQPIQMAEIREPQTAHLTSLHHEVGNHPSRGLTPSRLAALLDAAEQGDIVAQYELFEDIEEKDGHVHAEMGKRRRAVAQLEWQVVAPDNATAKEQEAAERLQSLLAGLDDFEAMLFDATDAIDPEIPRRAWITRRRPGRIIASKRLAFSAIDSQAVDDNILPVIVSLDQGFTGQII